MGSNNSTNPSKVIVRYLDETEAISCPYGDVRRLITGGECEVANLHVIRVTRGNRHSHGGYNEIYYILSGRGVLTIREDSYAVRPGTVAVIPAGAPHSLQSDTDVPMEFVIFGTPAVSLDDARAIPRKC